MRSKRTQNDTIINLSGRTLSSDEIDVFKLGLRHGLATRPNQFEIMAVSEDVWDQIARLNKFKDGRHIQDKIKNSLRSFTTFQRPIHFKTRQR